MNFMNAMQNELNNETQLTENGAVGYRTTGKKLLDLNFAVSSLRMASEQEIINKFMDAYYENPILAMQWLFYNRDARQGLGERRTFRVILKYLAEDKPDVVRNVIPLVAEYGRYDDLWCLLDTDLKTDVFKVIKAQLQKDEINMRKNVPISLLAKWLPSENASSMKTKRYAIMIREWYGLSSRDYRKMLSEMRKYIDVVERKMSAKQWDEINYETVPSRANLIYNNAFLRNDEERRREYLRKLTKGETKINASTLFPHDIVHKYSSNGPWIYRLSPKDAAIEALWKALPDTVQGCGNTIVVADGSGSMTSTVDRNSAVTALEVANALAIYFAERSSGEFKDKYITFSTCPQLVDLSKADSLHDKLQIALTHKEITDTNIERVFDLILTTAINNHMSQEDMPNNILIVSDMEFNSCATCSNGGYGHRPDQRLFKVIAKKYADAGYLIPRMIFWNVNSCTGTIPVKENELGVALVSGFSVNVVKMVMSGKTEPFECLLETLNSERYAPIEEALKG